MADVLLVLACYAGAYLAIAVGVIDWRPSSFVD